MIDALTIWHAAVEAVRSDRLVRDHVRVENQTLVICGQEIDLDTIDRIVVVGAGKAGAGMARGMEAAFGDDLLRDKQVTGWLNVPADCVQTLQRVHLHAARPAAINEPTAEGVAGTTQILEMVENAKPTDLCIALISGGGSALLPAPINGVTLEDKQSITRHLSSAGATIDQLNTVRKQLSRVKGEGLARACSAGQLVTLIISDVMGDPLDVIASGPTVPNTTTAEDALAVLHEFGASGNVVSVVERLCESKRNVGVVTTRVSNHVIGNNAVAVRAAVEQAQALGYETSSQVAERSEGSADKLGKTLLDRAISMRERDRKQCYISGGEPTVTLAKSEVRGLGGRNQQLVLAALAHALGEVSTAKNDRQLEGVTILSGGTDGEDGPTDAAGAWIDSDVATRAYELGLDPHDYLARNDAYHFLQQTNSLIQTGPTHTNVCDVRVVLTCDRS